MWFRIVDAVRADMQPSATRWRATARATLGFLLVIAWGMVAHIDQIYWGMASVAVLSMPSAATTMERAAMRILGTLAAAVIAVGWCAVALDSPPLFFGLLVASMAVAGYLWNASRFSYAMLVFTMTMVLVCYEATRDPGNALSTAWVRSTEIAAGVVATAIATLLIPPERSRDQFLRLCAAKVRRAGSDAGVLGRDAPIVESLLPTFEIPPAEQPIAMQSTLDTAAGEDGEVWRDRDRWMELQWQCERTRLALDDAARSGAELRAEHFPLDAMLRIRAVATAVNGVTDAVAASLEAARRSTEVKDIPPVDLGPLRESRLALDKVIAAQRAANAFATVPLAELSLFFNIVQGLESAAHELETIANEVATFKVGASNERPSARGVLEESTEVVTIFPLDRTRLLAGAKVGISVGVAMVVGLVVSPKIGGAAMVTAAVLSTCPHLGAFAQKAVQRVAAAVLGGAVGIALLVWALPNIGGLAGLLVVTAPVCICISYILAGGPRVNYIGFQAALGFGTGLVASPHPIVNLEGPLFRVLGVIVGILVCTAVLRLVAPIRVIDVYRASLAKLSGAVSALFGVLAEGASDGPEALVKRKGLRADAYSATAAALEASQAMLITSGWPDKDARLIRLGGALTELRVAYRQGLGLLLLLPRLPESLPTPVADAVAGSQRAARDELAGLAAAWRQQAVDGRLLAAARRESVQRLGRVLEEHRAALRHVDVTVGQAEAVMSQFSIMERLSRHLDRAWRDIELLSYDAAEAGGAGAPDPIESRTLTPA